MHGICNIFVMKNRENPCSEVASYKETKKRIQVEGTELDTAAKILSEEFGFKMEEKDWEDVRNGKGFTYGFDMTKDRVRELRRHCVSDNFPYFLEHHIVPLMTSWRKKYEKASREKHDQAFQALLETVSQDYKYGRVDKKMPKEEEIEAAEKDLYNNTEVTEFYFLQLSKEYYQKYIETQENMVNQLENIIESIKPKIFLTEEIASLPAA